MVTKPDENLYSTDAFTGYAVDQIRSAARDKTPFFLYVPYVAPHFPQQAWEKDVRKYLGRYRQGWEKLRRDRYARQVAMKIINPRYALSLCDGLPWDSLTERQVTDLDRQMAVYAAQIDNADQNIGRIMASLRENGLDGETLTIFLSDNGAQLNAPMGEDKNPQAVFGSRESFGQYAQGWANLSNTPFRRYKAEEYGGGNATPLILRWPGVLRDRGAIRDQPGHIIDIVPTCLEAAGLDAALRRGGITQKVEGISMLPFCRRSIPERPRTLFWEHEGCRAARIGDWKLVAGHNRNWELYNMREDRTELHDRVREYPARVRDLEEAYAAWAKRCNVLPWPVKQVDRRGVR